MAWSFRHFCIRMSLATAAVVLLYCASALPAQAVEVDTAVTVKGPEKLEEYLKAVIEANAARGRRPPEPITVLQRTQTQREEALRALRSEGYYAGTVAVSFAGYALDDPALFDQLEPMARRERIEVRFDIEAGERYDFKPPILLDAASGQPLAPGLIDLGKLAAREDRSAVAARVVAADEDIVRQLREQGRPYARIAGREVVVDHADRSMTVTWRVAPGPKANFGSVQFEGLERTREEFLARRLPFEEGESYTPEKVDALRDDLIGLGIFSSVRVKEAPQLDGQGRLPVTVEVVERAPRTIGIGANYATSEGFGARAYWQHRNLFGGAESLRLSAEVGGLLENKLTEPSFGVYANYREPDFLERHQALTAAALAERKILDAYTKQAVGGSIGIERLFNEDLKGSIGISLEHSIQKRDGTKERFTLIGLPATLALDRSNDLLNPTEGFRLSGEITPYADTLNPASRFIVGRLVGTAYFDFSSDKSTVLATRAAIASLLDLGTSIVPFDKRIYSGGGGSVRGYAYQSLGPRDGDDPLGGRSSLEMSVELRQRISGHFGMAAFIDAGNVWETSTPDPGGTLRFGAGIGARYYTDFGPLRFDVAVPLNRRKGDDRFGLYVSIGQAF